MQRRRGPLMVIFTTVFIDLVGFGLIIPLSPFLVSRYSTHPERVSLEVGLLMTVYSLMQFIFSPIWGQLSDRWGRRPILLMSLAASGVSHLGFALSDSLTMLFIARATAGIFSANISTAMAYIADVTDEKNRSKGMGLIGAAFGLGFILGPFMGGLLAHWGERFGESPPWGYHFPALVASMICFGNFLFACRSLNESLPAALRGQQKARPGRFRSLVSNLSSPVKGTLMVVFFLTTLAMGHMESASFLYVKDMFGWDLAKASYGFAYVGLIMIFTQGFLIRRILPKWGERVVVMLGLLFFTLGLACIGGIHAVSGLALGFTFLGLGNGMVVPALNGSISLLTESSEQGGVLGVNQSLSALGRIIGPFVGGWIYGARGPSAPFMLGAVWGILCLVLASSIYAKIPVNSREKLS